MEKKSTLLAILSCLPLLLIMFCAILVAGADDCNTQLNGLVANCMPAVVGTRPSSKCCKFVNEAQPECVCPRVTSDVTKVLSLKTALRIAKKCNRELPHNYQCGSYTLP